MEPPTSIMMAQWTDFIAYYALLIGRTHLAGIYPVSAICQALL